MARRIGGRRSGARHGEHAFVPDAGDLVWLSFDPQSGRAGRRPGLVLSAGSYNASAGLCLICPITSQAKGYPFEVTLPDRLAVQGVVVADHVKSADWRQRRMAYIAKAPLSVLDEVRAKLKPLLGV